MLKKRRMRSMKFVRKIYMNRARMEVLLQMRLVKGLATYEYTTHITFVEDTKLVKDGSTWVR